MVNFLKAIAFAVFFLITYTAAAQKIATLELTLNSETAGIDVPASVDLDNITILPDSVLILTEIQGKERVPVSIQIENNGRRMLHWLVKNNGISTKKRIYQLEKGNRIAGNQNINTVTTNGILNITANGHNLLTYNTLPHNLVYLNNPKDTFKRSGYIHPLFSPKGQQLTRIDAWDHPHHMGLWNPWTHVLFEGDTLDFWNLYKKEGNVRFANFTSINSGQVYAGYNVLHQHIVLKDHQDKVAMNEVQQVRIYQPAESQDYYLLDITIQLNAATAHPLTLLKYSYGSLGWRGSEKWNKDNSEVLTSEGATRKDADGSRARWCLIQGDIDNENAGAVMMTFPTNYNYPEPLRVWPENVLNGAVYANFVPVKDRDWVIESGREYALKYRFVVFNGKFNAEKSEAAWRNFAHPPIVKIIPNKTN